MSYNNAVRRLTFDVLQPLMFFVRLRALKLSLVHQIFINDKQLAELTCSWPMLTVTSHPWVSRHTHYVAGVVVGPCALPTTM